MPLPAFPQSGGCLCGAVRYQLTAPPRAVYACHCHDCQRAASGPYAIGLIVFADSFVLVSGADAVQRYEKPAQSGRLVPQLSCGTCGTRVWHAPKNDPSILIIRAGTLDDARWAKPALHMWTASRLPWITIDPDAPNYPGPVPSRDAIYAAWEAR